MALVHGTPSVRLIPLNGHPSPYRPKYTSAPVLISYRFRSSGNLLDRSVVDLLIHASQFPVSG